MAVDDLGGLCSASYPFLINILVSDHGAAALGDDIGAPIEVEDDVPPAVQPVRPAAFPLPVQNALYTDECIENTKYKSLGAWEAAGEEQTRLQKMLIKLWKGHPDLGYLPPPACPAPVVPPTTCTTSFEPKKRPPPEPPVQNAPSATPGPRPKKKARKDRRPSADEQMAQQFWALLGRLGAASVKAS